MTQSKKQKLTRWIHLGVYVLALAVPNIYEILTSNKPLVFLVNGIVLIPFLICAVAVFYNWNLKSWAIASVCISLFIAAFFHLLGGQFTNSSEPLNFAYFFAFGMAFFWIFRLTEAGALRAVAMFGSKESP